ncbi:MAG: respiratory chain complex I subunit 1 family protein [Exilispira sp.]
MKYFIFIILKILFLIFLPPLIIGLINRVKAIWAGKRGQSILQPFFDMLKLLKKQTIRSNYSSILTSIAIPLQLISMLTASMLIPFGKFSSIISFSGDFFLFIGLLSLSTFCQIIIAMESSGAFQGMGASRDINFSIFVEPALITVFGSMIFYTKNYSLTKMFIHFSFTSIEKTMIGILFGISFFLILLIEGKRIPVDDPATHLELTMIHEAMLLDLSGKDLVFVLYSGYLRIFIFATLIANIFIPAFISIEISVLIFLFIILLISILIGFIESLFPRVRMSHVPDFMLLVLSLSIIIVAIMFTMNT